MNEREQELFEAELRKLSPARPPEEFIGRMMAARPGGSAGQERGTRPVRGEWWGWLRWLAPAAAGLVLAAGLVIWQVREPSGKQQRESTALLTPENQADNIEIDRQLMASYDAVAELSGGEQVRFRCREWEDKVIFRDPERGIAVERRTPRLEIVPVRYETY